MKKTLLFALILILNLGLSAQVLTKFSWDGPLAAIAKADAGPDAISVSPGAVASLINVLGGISNNGISPGPIAKDIDLTLPNSSYYNTPSFDIAIDFRREETEAGFFTRGSIFDFGMSGGKLSVKFNVSNGNGGKTTISSGNIADIPNDHLFHNYRFMYDNMTGIANVWLDGVSKYTYTGTPNRAMYWTGAGSPVIGKQMDATGRNVAVLDNFEMRLVPIAVILPVKFVSFTSSAKTSGVELKWSVVNEENIRHYNVERSTDGLHFETITTVKAITGSTLKNDYEAKDVLNNKNVSYRISSVDLDGKKLYSDIRTVSAISAGAAASVTGYPNPATNVLNLKFEASDAATFTVSLFTRDGLKIQASTHQVEKGFSTTAIVLSSNVPHNSIVMVVIENKKTAAKEVIRLYRK